MTELLIHISKRSVNDSHDSIMVSKQREIQISVVILYQLKLVYLNLVFTLLVELGLNKQRLLVFVFILFPCNEYHHLDSTFADFSFNSSVRLPTNSFNLTEISSMQRNLKTS